MYYIVLLFIVIGVIVYLALKSKKPPTPPIPPTPPEPSSKKIEIPTGDYILKFDDLPRYIGIECREEVDTFPDIIYCNYSGYTVSQPQILHYDAENGRISTTYNNKIYFISDNGLQWWNIKNPNIMSRVSGFEFLEEQGKIVLSKNGNFFTYLDSITPGNK
jgi:hypothetical protein